MSSLFKHPGQTAPVKLAPVKPRVRPAKPEKKFSISFSLISLLSSLSLDREEQLDEELSSTR